MSEVSTGLHFHVHKNCVDLCMPAPLDNLAYEIIFTGDCRHSRNYINYFRKKSKRKVQGVPQSQIAALPRHQEKGKPTNPNKHKSIKHTKSSSTPPPPRSPTPSPSEALGNGNLSKFGLIFLSLFLPLLVLL